jgi:heat shock protein HslJ
MHVLKKMLVITGCALLLALLAPFATAPAGGTKAGPAADLREITVRSDRFPSGAVTLKNGQYQEPAVPGAAGTTVVMLTDWRAFGKVNGRDAAAVIIVTDTGGSGTFFDLALLFKREGGWVNVDTLFLGDRVKVHSVDIRDQEVLISMTTHGPGDALCCPTQKNTRRFAVQADRLIAQDAEKQTGIGMHDIVGPVWRWDRTRYNDDTMLTRDADAAGYSLQLKPDGTVQVRGDCNAAGGSFTLEGANLAIAITYTTMAACPDSSLEAPFFRDLNRTGGFILKNDRLFIDLKLGTGTMEFHK